MNISELKDFTELAQASYAHLQSIDYGNDENLKLRLSTYNFTQNGTFSAQQA